jgi:hypothetical protein
MRLRHSRIRFQLAHVRVAELERFAYSARRAVMGSRTALLWDSNRDIASQARSSSIALSRSCHNTSSQSKIDASARHDATQAPA